MTANLDYIFFFYGLSFIILSALLYPLCRSKEEKIPWKWLAAFAFVHGCLEWMDMFALSLGDNRTYSIIRIVVLALSFTCLIEFSLASNIIMNRRIFSRKIYLALFLLTALSSFYGIAGLRSGVRYFLGFPAGAWSALTLWRLRNLHQDSKKSIHALTVAGIAMGTYVILSGLIVSKASFFPASVFNQENFFAVFGIPVQLLRGISATIIAIAFWRYYLFRLSKILRNQLLYSREFFFIFLLLVILISGWIYTGFVSQSVELDKKRQLLHIAKQSVAAVSELHLEALSASVLDLENPNYIRLKEQLMRMRSTREDIRFIYIMRKVGDQAIFLVDSEASGSADESPPGQIYTEISPKTEAVFKTKAAVIDGPATDRWGTWISGIVPVFNGKKKLIAVLGVDLDYKYFKASILRERLKPILITLLFAILLIVFYISSVIQRDLELKLRQDKRKFEAIFDQTFQFIFLLSSEGRLIEANNSALEFSAVKEEEMVGKFFWDTCWWSHSQQEQEKLRLAFQKASQGEFVRFETIFTDFAGNIHNIDFSLKPVKDESGEVVMIIPEGRDVTMYRQIQDELNKTNIMLAQSEKMAALGRFSSGVAHQIKNPLAIILSGVELLENKLAQSEVAIKDCLSIIKEAVGRADSIIKHLFEYLRPSAAKFEKISISDLINAALEMVKHKASVNRIMIKTKISQEDMHSEIDKEQMQQVILNILMNAAEAMPDGGSIDINAYKKLVPELSSSEPANVIEIADTGVGIAPDDLEKIFEPFFSTKLKEKGTGLGLVVVKAFIDENNGKIFVDSELGKGTAVRIFLKSAQ
jgi:PAS domain S-box-containing protein